VWNCPSRPRLHRFYTPRLIRPPYYRFPGTLSATNYVLICPYYHRGRARIMATGAGNAKSQIVFGVSDPTRARPGDQEGHGFRTTGRSRPT
jgi:hypothetical protein